MGRMRSLRACLGRMRHASWSRVLFGEDPYLVLTLLLLGGLVIYPLIGGVWPFILPVLGLAAAVHVWLWCRQHETEDNPVARTEDGRGPE